VRAAAPLEQPGSSGIQHFVELTDQVYLLAPGAHTRNVAPFAMRLAPIGVLPVMCSWVTTAGNG